MAGKDGPDLLPCFSQDFTGSTLQSGSGGAHGRGGDIGSHNKNTVIHTVLNIESVANLSYQLLSSGDLDSTAGHQPERSPPPDSSRHGQALFRSQMIGHNGTDTGTFDDIARVSPQPGCPTIAGISKIELQHGRWVHHMAITYILSSGASYKTVHGQNMWSPFSIGFCTETIELLDSEQIIAVAGCSSSYMIHEIEFHIQDMLRDTVRTVGPFGNCRAASWIPVIDSGTIFHCKGNIIAFAGTYNRGYGISPFSVIGGLSFICSNSRPELTM